MVENKIRLYHGSKSGIKDSIKPISRELCDFSKGFYMGTEKEQPMTLICNYDNATMYDLELDLEKYMIQNHFSGSDTHTGTGTF